MVGFLTVIMNILLCWEKNLHDVCDRISKNGKYEYCTFILLYSNPFFNNLILNKNALYFGMNRNNFNDLMRVVNISNEEKIQLDGKEICLRYHVLEICSGNCRRRQSIICKGVKRWIGIRVVITKEREKVREKVHPRNWIHKRKER